MARKQKTAAQKAKAKATCEKRIGEARQKTVEKIIEMMERDGLNWVKTWTTNLHVNVFDQMNPITGTHYRGGNVLRLATECIESGLDDNRWCTAWEAKKMGWIIRDGAHAGTIEKWKRFSFTRTDKDGNPILDADGNEQRVTYYKPVSFFYVYNFSEIDGAPQLDRNDHANERERVDLDDLIDALKETSRCPMIERYGDSAHYMPGFDKIEVPERDQFAELANAMRTYLHEMGHSTMHPDACDRDFTAKRHGDRGYAYEELVAELTATFAAAYLGCALGDFDQVNYDNHAAYLKGWLSRLRDDVTYLYNAAADASKACDYIIDRLVTAHPEYKRDETTIEIIEETIAA